MKKIISISMALICSAALLAGCTKEKSQVSDAQKVEMKTLQFGTLPAQPSIPVIIAKEKGFFDKAGVKVEVVPFNSPNDRNVAVQAGKLDGTIADIMTSLTFHEAGVNMDITSDINEDFKLLTSPKSGIDSFDKLNNKDVSLVPNFVLEYIMDRMAEKNNIKYKVTVIPSISARFEALLADKISGVMFSEPQASQLAGQGAKVLATSEQYGLKAGTIMFNEKTLKENAKEVKAFYAAYNEAVDYINKTEASEYAQVLSKYSFPDTVVKFLKSGVKYRKAEKINEDSFKDVLKWTKVKGLVKKDYNFEDVSNFNFIQ